MSQYVSLYNDDENKYMDAHVMRILCFLYCFYMHVQCVCGYGVAYMLSNGMHHPTANAINPYQKFTDTNKAHNTISAFCSRWGLLGIGSRVHTHTHTT